MDIKRNGSQPASKGPAEYFTGTVRIDPLFEAPDPARARGASVTFAPGARSAWHTHPLGQTLIVTSGCGWMQSEGDPKMEIRRSDVVSCPPKEKHGHGATSTTAVTHIAIQEKLDGKVVEWLEKGQQRTIPGPNSELIWRIGLFTRQKLFRCQCGIATRIYHNRAARSERTRCKDRNPFLRRLPLRGPPGAERVEQRHAYYLPIVPGHEIVGRNEGGQRIN
jgi:quercetin dioxygenase-like cupin family protein